jgi:hypothetical protein
MIVTNSRDMAGATAESGEPVAADLALHAILALLGVCGIVIVLLSTWRYGVGTFPDAEHYLGAARSLLAGQGYRYYFGGYYTHWPPLFPTLLAAVGLVGIDPQVGARLLNSLAFGLIVFFSGQLFRKSTTSGALAVAGTVAVLASAPLLDSCVMAASEPVFALLTIAFVLCLPRFLRRRRPADLLLVSVLAALACLQRYAGLSLVLAGLLLIGSGTSRVSLLRRLGYLVIFGVIATTPVALWCLRNHFLAGATVGLHDFHPASERQLLASFRAVVRVMATWLFPWAPAGSIPSLGLGLPLAWAGAMVIGPRLFPKGPRRSGTGPTVDSRRADGDGLLLGSVAVCGLVYVGFLTACGASLGWHPEQRHMVPIYALVMALMVAGIGAACRLLSEPLGRRRIDFLGVFLCALWLLYPLRELFHNTAHRMRDGAGVYTTTAWENSPLVEWVRRHPVPGRIYSNAPDAIYLLTGVAAWLTPQSQYEFDPAEFARANTRESYILWFHGLHRLWLYDRREVLSGCDVQELATFPDGSIYRYRGPGGPRVAAVYRFWSPRMGRHFYTIQKAERDRRLLENDGTWAYEGPVFYAFAPGRPRPAAALPVYELQSPGSGACFYTMDEAEKDRLLNGSSGTWTCKGAAFYAWPQPGVKDTLPVHRFWSGRLGCHLYTIDEKEKVRLATEFSQTWTYEGVAWYAYGP